MFLLVCIIAVLAAALHRQSRRCLNLVLAKQESEQRFLTLADYTSVLIWTTAVDSTCDWVNTRWCEYAGTPLSAHVGFGWTNTVHPDDRDPARDKFLDAFSSRSPFTLEYRLRRFDGAYRWHTVFASPRFDAAGRFFGYVGMSFDSHAARTYADKLKKANQDLEQFAYVASHDLKQPLRSIDNLATWIDEDAAQVLPKESKQHLAQMRGRITRMGQLLDDLLEYARAGNNVVLNHIDAGECLRDANDLLAFADGSKVNSPQTMPTVYGSRVLLTQVFRNLVGNSLKHFPAPVEVTVDFKSTDDTELPMVEFSVRDNGPGIDPKFAERVFNLFTTLQPRDTIEGSGMGLALVRKIVESHQGQVWIDSTVEGLCVCFRWPTQPTALSIEPDAGEIKTIRSETVGTVHS